MAAAYSITTAPERPGRAAPYEDEVRDDGLLVYRYQGTDPNNHHNRSLRRAFELGRPLIYFLGVAKGRYRPFWPAMITEDDPAALRVAVTLYDTVELSDLRPLGTDGVPAARAYARRVTLQRLHQAGFRDRVLRAYRSCCAMCRLRHVELLDAAHILPDAHPLGRPVVENGMALCKIHHAAFDRQILGVRPDYVIELRHDLLDEIDGPMLQHGLQAMHGALLELPRRVADRPNTEFLEARYETFRAAG